MDSHEAAVHASWLGLLTGVIRNCGVEWLTDIDSLIVSESKLVQIAAAGRIGVPTPRTVVTSQPDAARQILGEKFVIKPLGPGHYFENDTPLAVFATEVDAVGAIADALHTVPFLAQERLRANEHLRVVVVRDEVWAARLPAGGLSLDWRQDEPAHRSFLPCAPPAEVAEGAIAISRELHLQYASQDWCVTDAGCFLLDVNPGGQWLFLPTEVASRVTRAIGRWLNGTST
jgi:glutathione synthase/RimK-type ligase-like ATP-grasp enzyme